MLDSSSVILALYSEEKIIETFELGSIGYGEGKMLSIENLRLSLVSSTDAITFVLTSPNKEISTENNRLTLVVS